MIDDMDPLRANFDNLFAGAARAERNKLLFELNRAMAGNGSVVLFGAGQTGRCIAARLPESLRSRLLFMDETPHKQGTFVDGIKVLAPDEVLAEVGPDAPIVVCIYQNGHRFLKTRERLAQLGFKAVFPAVLLAWRHPDSLLPFFGFPVPEQIEAGIARYSALFELFQESQSRACLVGQLALRLQLDFETEEVSGSASDLPKPVELALSKSYVYVDCGAYDGDSIERLLTSELPTPKRIEAYEPDEANFQQLQAYCQQLPAGLRQGISLNQAAVGEVDGTAAFEQAGNSSSHLSEDGDAPKVKVVALDDRLNSAERHFIKFDVEGAEASALRGCRRLIRQSSAILAISVYHRPNDLLELPAQLLALNPDYQLFLRSHDVEGIDTMLYAVPVAS